MYKEITLDLDTIKNLIDKIYVLLDDQSSSLIPLLNNALRLANLVNDEDMIRLFEVHLEGIDSSIKEGLEKKVSRYTHQNKPSKKSVEMTFLDRSVELDEITAHSAEDLEEILYKFNSIISEGNNSEEIFNTRNQISSVIRRIKSRVNSFTRNIEYNIQVMQKVEKARIENDTPNKIFIGHGRSQAWRGLKDFLQDRLRLDWDEYNREATAGMAIKERLEEMLNQASFAFLIMTAEDEHTDETFHARENVIHEVGLFQGKLGFRKAIVLLEEGCQEFSNIHGLSQIRFPTGNILAKSEEIRRVLEREGILENN